MTITSIDKHRDSASRRSYSEAEWQTRVDLAACYRLVHYYGWTTQVYNHITARIPGTELLLINPFGMLYDELRPADLINDINDEPDAAALAHYYKCLVPLSGHSLRNGVKAVRGELVVRLKEKFAAVEKIVSGAVDVKP
jgi:hypothetical protein